MDKLIVYIVAGITGSVASYYWPQRITQIIMEVINIVILGTVPFFTAMKSRDLNRAIFIHEIAFKVLWLVSLGFISIGYIVSPIIITIIIGEEFRDSITIFQILLPYALCEIIARFNYNYHIAF